MAGIEGEAEIPKVSKEGEKGGHSRAGVGIKKAGSLMQGIPLQ